MSNTSYHGQKKCIKIVLKRVVPEFRQRMQMATKFTILEYSKHKEFKSLNSCPLLASAVDFEVIKGLIHQPPSPVSLNQPGEPLVDAGASALETQLGQQRRDDLFVVAQHLI